MIEQVQALAKARETLAEAEAALEAAVTALYETPEGARVLDAKEKHRAAAEAASQARSLVELKALQAHADGQPLARGVTIKMYQAVRYDADQAMAWCIEHARKYLKLDERAFEKGAPVLMDLGAPVTLAKEPRVTIASNLSASIDPADVPF